MSIDLPTLHELTGGKRGVTDAACPTCGPDCRTPSNRTRKVMRIWEEDGFFTYCCARCSASGWAKDERSGHSERPRPVKTEPVKDNSELARLLWDRSLNPLRTPVEAYLRKRECLVDSPSIRFLPRRGEHFNSMISRFGIGGEVSGVHLTRLRPDGTGKDKIMLGRSMGQPIVVHDNPERLELFIAEGVEDAASLGLATGLTTWAAGSAGRISAVVPLAKHFNSVFIAVDNDFAGRRALQRARESRQDVIALDFGNEDANSTLQKFGIEAILTTIDRCFVSPAASIRAAA